MFRVIVLMFFVFLIVGCGEENDYSVNRVDSYDLSAPHSIKNRSLSGSIFIPQEFLVDSVSLCELDSCLNKIQGRCYKGTVMDSEYSFLATDYKSPYVIIELHLRFSHSDSVVSKITFLTLSNISLSLHPRLSIESHLESKRVKKLYEDGYPFHAAKSKSAIELERLLGARYGAYTEDDSLYRYDPMHPYYISYGTFNGSAENFFPYVMLGFLVQDSLFKQNVDSFTNYFSENGQWFDSDKALISADYCASNRDTIIKWVMKHDSIWLYSQRDLNELMSNLLENVYGFPECKAGFYGNPNSGSSDIRMVNENPASIHYGDSLVCDHSKLTLRIWRLPYDSLERKFGFCTYAEKAEKTIVMTEDSLYYVCLHNDTDRGWFPTEKP